MKTIADVGEFALLQKIQTLLGPKPKKNVLVGLGDDAAIVRPTSFPLVVTTDAMVEDVHFRRDWYKASDIAYKALASNLSDLAAKSAEPAFGVITLGLPVSTSIEWVEQFYSSLSYLQNRWNIDLIGGDTVVAEKIFVSITVWGYQKTEHPIQIDGAKIGDTIFVSGTLGDSKGGLELLRKGDGGKLEYSHAQRLKKRFLCPEPRTLEALTLTKHVIPTSMTDISDGMGRDLLKICEASQVGASIDSSLLPISDSLKKFTKKQAIHFAWEGGEDYELLFTVPSEFANVVSSHWANQQCDVHAIGTIVDESEGIVLKGWKGKLPSGYYHFKTK